MISIAVLTMSHQHIPSKTLDEEQNVNDFLTAIMISLLSGTLILLKKGLDEKYVTVSFEILILMITPFSAFIPILAHPKTFWIIIPVYYAVIISWFLFADHSVIGNTKRDKNGKRERDPEQHYASNANLKVFIILMSMSIFIFYWYFLLIVPHPENTLS